MVLDELDQQILRYLQDDGRTSYVALANLLGVSEGTIRKRIRKLELSDVLQIVGVTDPFKIGLDTVAFLWLEIKRGMLESVIDELKRIVHVRYLVVATGSHDLVATVVLPSREKLIDLLNEQLPKIPGIISTETSIVLQVHKQIHNWIPFNDTDQRRKSIEIPD